MAGNDGACFHVERGNAWRVVLWPAPWLGLVGVWLAMCLMNACARWYLFTAGKAKAGAKIICWSDECYSFYI